MNPRQDRILHKVRAEGFVTIDALAEEFQVTPQTIRRDINTLCENGHLRRYHGGAGLPSSVDNVDYAERQVLNLDAKRTIATMVAQRIPNHASLCINLGTTTEEVARALINHEALRVITNNLNVAMILADSPGCEVIVTGGVVRARDRGLTGEATMDFIRQFRVDTGIIGISGIEPDGTLRDFDYREVRVAQTIIAQSRQVFLVADHTKFGRNAFVELGHISQVRALFTDRCPPAPYLNVLQDSDTQIYTPANCQTDIITGD